MKIEKVLFLKKKYGKELHIDCSRHSKSGVVLRKDPFVVDFYGVYIIIRGNGSILIDNNSCLFSRGSLIFFQPFQVRQWQDTSDDFDGYFLIFESEFIETFFQDPLFIYRFQFFHNINISCTLECDDEFLNSLIETCKTISCELSDIREDTHHFLRSILYNILIRINRKYIERYGLSADLFQNNLALQLKKMIEANIRQKQRVEEYADLLKISRAHLNNIAKRAFGMPVSLMIRDRLLTEIKRELLFTNKTIKEICYEMNFSDFPNFIRFFRNNTGINPGNYRLQYTK